MVNGDYRDKHYGADLGIVRNSEIINDHIFSQEPMTKVTGLCLTSSDLTK